MEYLILRELLKLLGKIDDPGASLILTVTRDRIDNTITYQFEAELNWMSSEKPEWTHEIADCD